MIEKVVEGVVEYKARDSRVRERILDDGERETTYLSVVDTRQQ